MNIVSIIIPCYNYAHFLPDAIESCLAQTYPEIEIIIVNDGSTDNTLDVINHYTQLDSRVRLINQSNMGLSTARNVGVEAATGQYYQFLDADDVLLPDKIRRSMEIANAAPSNTIVVVRCENRDSTLSNIDFSRPTHRVTFGSENLLSRFLNYTPFHPHAPLIPAELFHKTGGFCDSIRAAEDWYMWIALLAHGAEYLYLDELLVLYRVHENNMTSNRVFVETEKQKAIHLLHKLPLPDGSYDKGALLMQSHLRLGTMLANEGKFIQSLRNFLNAFYVRPDLYTLRYIANWMLRYALHLKNQFN